LAGDNNLIFVSAAGVSAALACSANAAALASSRRAGVGRHYVAMAWLSNGNTITQAGRCCAFGLCVGAPIDRNRGSRYLRAG